MSFILSVQPKPLPHLVFNSFPECHRHFPAINKISPLLNGWLVKNAAPKTVPYPSINICGVVERKLNAKSFILRNEPQRRAQNANDETIRVYFGKSDPSSFGYVQPGFCSCNTLNHARWVDLKSQKMSQAKSEFHSSFSATQSLAMFLRETSDSFSLGAAEPFNEVMKKSIGDGKTAEYGSAFFNGAFCSVAGHPLDTFLTHLQTGMKVDGLRQLLKGVPAKALTLGGFSIVYQFSSEALESWSSPHQF